MNRTTLFSTLRQAQTEAPSFHLKMVPYNYIEPCNFACVSDIKWDEEKQTWMWGVYIFLSRQVWIFRYIPEADCIEGFDLLNPNREPLRVDFAVEFVGCRVSKGDPRDPANHHRVIRYFGTKENIRIPESAARPWVHLREVLPKFVYPNSGEPDCATHSATL